ncbi:hypothetical protein VB715_20950 [Crocosphaera sp. UHCC 0190]|uniref:hypothetical protein n=1 Tax=Crocosphaera sp. UHCC 0190 TaxID=3110246 RepID=UPI002B207E4B|nr:hypothetical protein [Crocosphaera sp. UHCC 0190]MEA5512244.1 hypothetical protein [Crocosphaera sp. UHCC 0190]
MPSALGNFDIWTQGNPKLAKRFVVWKQSQTDEGTLIVSCQTPKEAERYCAYLNAVINGQIKIPRSQKKYR